MSALRFLHPGFPWVASFFASSVLERIALIFLDWWLARWAEEADVGLRR